MTPEFTYDQINRGMVEHPARTAPARQPPYEMQDAYILTKEKWIELCEHLTIGCTNQKAFLDSLEATHTSPPAPALLEESEQWREAYQNGYTDGQAKAAIENERINAQVAKAAREQVLDAMEEWINSDDCLTLYKWQVRESIRFLRSQQEPSTKGGAR